MSTQPGAATSSSMFESGASNTDILESIGSEILAEHGDQSSASSPSASEGAAGAGATPSPVGEGGAEGQIVRPEWYETAPNELKGLLDHKNISAEAKKWIEDSYGELNTFRGTPIGTKEAVQEIADIFPGGLEDIRTAHTNAAEFVREMEQFNSNDPSQQSELLATLLQSNPDAFVSIIGVGADLLKQTLRDDYTSFASNIAHEHLESITDGKFASFFDSVADMAQKYHSLSETNPEEAAKLASKLGGAALQMADWWPSAKNKLGYGEKQVQQHATPGNRAPVVNNQVDQREIGVAQREAQLFESNYMIKHDSSINPIIQSALTRDLAARKLDLPQSWQAKVMDLVAKQVKEALPQDKTYLAIEQRVYRKDKDVRKWDKSDQVSKTLLAAAKQRAEKLIPNLLKRALDDISSLRGQQRAAVTPGAATRGGGGSPAAAAASGNAGWEQDLKDGKISGSDAILRMAGY